MLLVNTHINRALINAEMVYNKNVKINKYDAYKSAPFLFSARLTIEMRLKLV